MDPRYNSQAYTNKEKAINFISMLLAENADKKSDYFNDIHIRQEESLIIIEWTQIYYDYQLEMGSFKYVNPDQQILTEYIFPDNHTELCVDEDDYRERLKEFCDQNDIKDRYIS